MNVTVERAPLLAAMGRIGGVVNRTQTIPILGNVAVSAGEGEITLRATDLDMEAIEVVPAQVGEPGGVTIPADKLHDIVREVSGSSVSISKDAAEPRAKVSCGRSRFNVATQPIEDFPKFPADGLSEPWAFPAKMLADMLERVAFCRAPPSPMTALSCTFLTAVNGELRAVTCQSSGIAMRREAAPKGAEISVVLLPKLTAQLTRWLANVEGDVEISSAPGKLVRFRADGCTLTSAVFDGPYVDYSRLLMEAHELSSTTDQDALSTGVRRVMVMGEAKGRAVRLCIGPDAIGLSARNQLGDSDDEIGCEFSGEPASILLAADDLQAAISSLKGDAMELAFAPAIDPKINRTGQVVIRAPSDSGLVINLMQPRA